MKIKSLLTLSALLLTSTAASAQVQHLEGDGLRVTTDGPPVYHTLDLDTGRIRPSNPETVSYLKDSVSSDACYSNTIDADLVTDVLVFPATDEILDWGIKNCGGSAFVERITIGYGSFAASTAQGGPGGSFTLRIYEQAFGFGNFGTEVLSLTLDGLPSASTMLGGPVSPQFLTIELGSQSFFLPDGPIAWSLENPDGATGPILVDSTVPLGVQNYIDVYRPGPATAGHYLGTYMFPAGGVSNDPFENSFYIELHQNETQASALALTSPLNPNAFTTQSGPVVGSKWVSTVSIPAGSSFSFVILSLQSYSGPTTSFGDYLVDLSQKVGKTSVKTNGIHRYSIPLDSSLIGLRLFAQAGYDVNSGAGLQLTNALDLRIGAL